VLPSGGSISVFVAEIIPAAPCCAATEHDVFFSRRLSLGSALCLQCFDAVGSAAGRLSDDQDGCEWENVSCGTSPPG